MPFLILVLFIGVPILEIALFIEVGGWLGLWPTLGIVVLTALVGTALLRQQGLSTLFRLRQKLEDDELPVREVFDGLCLLLAGAALLTPGFATDAIGLLLFVPPFRAWLGGHLGRWVVARSEIHIHTGGPSPRRPGGGGPVIDGEYDDVTPSSPPPPLNRPRDGP